MGTVIRIGSRSSRLAVVQSKLIMEEIQKIMPDAKLELVTMKTTGDKILHQTLDKIGGKGLFLKELDAALLSGKVDLCIHSLKDVPTEENAAIPLGAYSIRETPGDVLVLPKGVSHWNPAQPVGCASLRRTMQFQELYPGAVIKPIRGNVLTRLEKLDSGAYDALILAEAGLKRLNLSDRISVRFSTTARQLRSLTCHCHAKPCRRIFRTFEAIKSFRCSALCKNRTPSVGIARRRLFCTGWLPCQTPWQPHDTLWLFRFRRCSKTCPGTGRKNKCRCTRRSTRTTITRIESW